MKHRKNAAKPMVLTKFAMAKRLEISRTTLDKYMGMPGAPGRGRAGYDLGKVADWIATQSASEATLAKTSDEIRRLKEKELGIRCSRLGLKLKQERGELVLLESVRSELGSSMQKLKARLCRILEFECPQAMATMDFPSARIIGKRIFDALCEWCQGEFGSWKI